MRSRVRSRPLNEQHTRHADATTAPPQPEANDAGWAPPAPSEATLEGRAGVCLAAELSPTGVTLQAT
jgi:hypothetical protein